jgi:hypothetical protein
MADKWTVRDKHGVITGPMPTEELGALIVSGKAPPTVFVSMNGSQFRPANEFPQLQGFKAPEGRDWRALWPLAAGLFVVLVLVLGYRFLKGGTPGQEAPADNALTELLADWPDAAPNGTLPAAQAATDPATCERQAAGVLQKEPQNDAALRLLAVCASTANRFGGQKHRDSLGAYLDGRPGDYTLERGALLATMPLGDRGARAEALLRQAYQAKKPGADFLLARLLVQRLPDRKRSAADDPQVLAAWAVLQPIAPAHLDLAFEWALRSARFHAFQTLLADPKTADTPLVIRFLRATLGCEWGSATLQKLAAAPDVLPEALAELGLSAGACGVSDAARVLLPFEQSTDPKKKRAAKLGLAALRLSARDVEGAKTFLYDVEAPADGEEDAAASRYVRATLALHLGDYGRAIELYKSSGLTGAALGAFVAELMQSPKSQAPAPVIFGVAAPFVSAVLSDRVDDVRLDALLDAPDVLHALNPGKVPLLEAIVAAPLEQLRKKQKLTESERALVGLFDTWLGAVPKVRAAGEGGVVVAALLALQKQKATDAVRALDRLMHGPEAAPHGIATLRARVLEMSAPNSADEVWAQLGESSEDLEPAAEMAAARAAERSGDHTGAAARYRALYFSGEAPLEAVRALAAVSEELP